MARMADGGGQHLGAEIGVVVENGADIADEGHAVLANVVHPPDEGRDERGPGLGGEQRLVGREAQRHVDHDAVLRERPAGLEAGPGERHLDRHVFGDRGELAGLGKHGFLVGRCHLRADGAFHKLADLAHGLDKVAAGLGDKRGVGGDAIEQARGGKLADFGDFRRVGEEFHGVPSFVSRGFASAQDNPPVVYDNLTGRQHFEQARHTGRVDAGGI